MEVILLSDVENTGLRGEVVNVPRGYARNFLLPRKLAEPATPAKVAELQKREQQRARHEANTIEQAQQMADTLGKTQLRFDVKAGPTGSLFGSVTPTDIADQIWSSAKIRVDRRKIGTDSLKRIGRYEIPIELFGGVTVDVKTMVVPEGGELPSEDELAAMEATERAEQEAAAPQEPEVDLEEVIAADDEATSSGGRSSRSRSGRGRSRRPVGGSGLGRSARSTSGRVELASLHRPLHRLGSAEGIVRSKQCFWPCPEWTFGGQRPARCGYFTNSCSFFPADQPFPPPVKTELSTR